MDFSWYTPLKGSEISTSRLRFVPTYIANVKTSADFFVGSGRRPGRKRLWLLIQHRKAELHELLLNGCLSPGKILRYERLLARQVAMSCTGYCF
jgi:hypothetical protein